MKTLADYLYRNLSPSNVKALLLLYTENPALELAKIHGATDPYYLLATALYSGSSPKLPKLDLNRGGIYPAIEEE